ncbi:DUF5655 domain-containing protein [Nocardia sp. NPDC051832]|uniref:DUF5655 domain-containing protein n=1 Tax=Nocardia sp. NPDC051832 TaxID=3155673 RepID=UPI0034147C00
MADKSATPEDYLAGHATAAAVYKKLCSILADAGSYDIRVTKSQIAFRRKRNFAFLWLPGQYLKNPDAEVVVSFVLDREVKSKRFKEVAHPAPERWMHHLEVRKPGDLDQEVGEWLRAAADSAQ